MLASFPLPAAVLPPRYRMYMPPTGPTALPHMKLEPVRQCFIASHIKSAPTSAYPSTFPAQLIHKLEQDKAKMPNIRPAHLPVPTVLHSASSPDLTPHHQLPAKPRPQSKLRQRQQSYVDAKLDVALRATPAGGARLMSIGSEGATRGSLLPKGRRIASGGALSFLGPASMDAVRRAPLQWTRCEGLVTTPTVPMGRDSSLRPSSSYVSTSASEVPSEADEQKATSMATPSPPPPPPNIPAIYRPGSSQQQSALSDESATAAGALSVGSRRPGPKAEFLSAYQEMRQKLALANALTPFTSEPSLGMLPWAVVAGPSHPNPSPNPHPHPRPHPHPKLTTGLGPPALGSTCCEVSGGAAECEARPSHPPASSGVPSNQRTHALPTTHPHPTDSSSAAAAAGSAHSGIGATAHSSHAAAAALAAHPTPSARGVTPSVSFSASTCVRRKVPLVQMDSFMGSTLCTGSHQRLSQQSPAASSQPGGQALLANMANPELGTSSSSPDLLLGAGSSRHLQRAALPVARADLVLGALAPSPVKSSPVKSHHHGMASCSSPRLLHPRRTVLTAQSSLGQGRLLSRSSSYSSPHPSSHCPRAPLPAADPWGGGGGGSAPGVKQPTAAATPLTSHRQLPSIKYVDLSPPHPSLLRTPITLEPFPQVASGSSMVPVAVPVAGVAACNDDRSPHAVPPRVRGPQPLQAAGRSPLGAAPRGMIHRPLYDARPGPPVPV